MKNFLIALFIFCIWSIFGMWWYYQCSWCTTPLSPVKETQVITPKPKEKSEEIVKENVVKPIKDSLPSPIAPIVQKTATNFIIYSEKNDTLFAFNKPINIYQDTSFVYMPYANRKYKDSIFHYLNANQDKSLHIVGCYHQDEIKADSVTTLGIVRARAIHDELVKFGVNPNRITVADEKVNLMYDNRKFDGGLQLFMRTMNSDKQAKITSHVTHKILYSGFNQRNFRADKELQVYAQELKSYLIKHPNKHVQIIGHTDSNGEEEVNIIFGRDRAVQVMNYLISQGVPQKNLEAISKGESEPLADNKTREGQAKNRRIEIKIN